MSASKRKYLVGGAALGVALLAGGAAAAVRKLDGTGKRAKVPPDLSLSELRSIMAELPDGQAREYLPLLNLAMREGGLFDTVERLALFLAQLAHESDQLTRWVEGASGQAYEGRESLGNTVPGDGPRFKGRGPIQLTGRYNYSQAGKALGIDLVNHPEDAALPAVGFLVAVWYWNSRNLSPLADAGDLLAVTKKINGGTNGLEQRQFFYTRALGVLAHRRAVA